MAMEMLEVIARKHEGVLSFKPRELDAVVSTSFVQMEDRVIEAKMKARYVAPELHVCLGQSVLVVDMWLQLVMDRGCSWL